MALGIATALVLAGLGFAMPAVALDASSVHPSATAGSSSGSISLSPLKTSAAVGAGDKIIPITLSNGEDSAVRVSVTTSGLSEQSDGVPQFTGPAPAPTNVPEPNFTLAPGQQRIISVTITVTNDTAGVYEGILATVSPVSQSSGVASRSRLASIVELTGPATATTSATIDSITATVSAAASAPKHLTITAPVHNTGNVLIAPTGNATISVRGKTLATIPLTAGRIVPGASFDYSAGWNETTPLRGQVQIGVSLVDPAANATKTLTFSDGAAPTATAHIRIVTVHSADHQVALGLRITNTGTSDLHDLTISTTTFTGQHELTLASGDVATLAPLHSSSRSQKFTLSTGEHVVKVELLEHGAILDQQTTTVDVTSGLPASVILILIAAALAIIIAALIVFLRLRGRRRRNEASA